ncbi:MAG: hypothetical protein SchgKO_04690 [Schleiferiaceae bacterium]
MKKFSLIISLLILITACKPEIKDIGTRYAPTDGIPGTWSIYKIEMIDQTVPVPETEDVTRAFEAMGNNLTLTIKEDGTYTVDETWYGPDFFGTSGTWMLNAEEYADSITFYTAEGDTSGMALLNMVRAIDPYFGVKAQRNKCDKNYAAYDLTFSRN